MTNIFIDPVIIMTPADDENREGIEVWLANLGIWLKEALSGYHTWLHSVEVTNLLEENGQFPGFALLRNWQRTYRLNINPAQLVKNINEFFRNPDFDLTTKLLELEYIIQPQAGSVIIQPEQIPARWPDFMQEPMRLLLATTCAC